jgi:hypothetical protein
MQHVCLLGYHILYLAHTLPIQQTVLVVQRQAQRFRDWIEIAGNGDQARMARVCGINTTYTSFLLPMSCKIAQRAPQQKPIAPTLFAPGI